VTGYRRTLTSGALAGYAASRTMDVVTTWFYARQSDASRRRELELAPGGTLVQLGRQLAVGAAAFVVVDEATALPGEVSRRRR
jgi:hypothetical protein